MTNEQIDRALNLLERYVAVQETNSRIAIERCAERDARDERAVAAQEALSEGFAKPMHVTASLAKEALLPTVDEAPKR